MYNTISKTNPQKNMGSNEKPIINLTMCIKVQYLFSITPLYNGVPGAHNWDLSHAPFGKSQTY